MTDYTRSYGSAALGGRLRRLSESIDEDAGRLYADLGIKLQQRWVGTLEQLATHGPQSVTELAEALGIRHSSVSQTRRSLEEAGLLESDPHENDKRSRVLRLSASGKKLVRRLEPIWDVMNATATALDKEAGQLIEALDKLDLALKRRSLYERVKAKL